jgi:hypothetical protein
MASKPLIGDLIAGHKGLDQELKTEHVPSPLGASDEVRAKLVKHQLTEHDMAAAVDWARVQAPND